METNIIDDIIKFFDSIDDIINNYVDKVELTPVQITNTAYITGFKRSQSNFQNIEVHIKEIRKVKIQGINTSITDEGGWLMMEPDGEIWINSTMITNTALKITLDKFKEILQKLNQLHIMMSKWKDEGENFSHVEVTLFENKRVACKEALNMRKKHKNVSNKFQTYNKQGELIQNNITKQYEPSDFELVTCKI